MENDKNNGLGDSIKQYDGDIKNSFKDKAKKWQKFVAQVPSTFEDFITNILVFNSLSVSVHLKLYEGTGQSL